MKLFIVGLTNLMQSMTAFWDNVRFLAREPETKTQGLKTDRTLIVIFDHAVIFYDRDRRHVDRGVRTSVILFVGRSYSRRSI